MLSLVTNGYTAAEVADVILGKAGFIERRWRFEVYDAFGNFLRKTYSVREGGNIKYVAAQNIARGGSIQIEEKLFTLVDDYFDYNGDDNFELELPTLYSLIIHESAIGYWRLGEGSGTSAADSTGNAHTGTYTGGVTLNNRGLCEAALTNGSALFDGTNDYVTIPHSSAFSVSNITVEAWIKTSYSAARQYIASRDDTSSNRQFGFRTLGTSTDPAQVGYLQFYLNFSGPTTQTFTALVNVCNGVPHHCVATYNGSFVDIYVDGVRVLHTAETRSMLTPTIALVIGALGNISSYWHGNIDEVAFYGYALSASQVRARFQAGSGQLYEIDFLHDQIKAYCAIKMPTAGTDLTYWAEYSRGFFSFIYPDRDTASTGTFYSGLIQDLIAKLEAVTVRTSNYTIAITKKYREALQDLFTYAGFAASQYSIAISTISETTLPVSKEYQIGTTILSIMNELLTEMNYRKAVSSSTGIVTLVAWVSTGDRATEFTLNADSDSIVFSDYKQNVNLKDIYNDIYLKRQGVKGVAELIGTAQITDASHPMAVSRVGYKTYSDLNVVAADQTTINTKALKIREEKGRLVYRLELQIPLLCILDNFDVLRILGITPPPLFSAGFFNPPDKFDVVEWSEPFSDVGLCQITAEVYLTAA